MNLTYPLHIRVYRAAVSAFFFLAGLTFATWASRIPDIKERLNLSEAELGGVLFALPVGQMVSLPISAWAVQRFGSRATSITAAILYPLMLLPLAGAGSTIQLLFGLFAFGLFANGLNIAMNTQAVGVERMYGRSIMASFHGLWSLAGFTGAFVSSLFVSAGASTMVHFSVVCIAGMAIVLGFSRFTLATDEGNENKQPLFSKPDRYILLLGVIAFCCMICEGAMADWSGVYFQKVVEAPARYVPLGYVAFMSTMAAGRFLGDRLVSRYGVKRILQASGIGIASGLLLSILVPSLWAATAGFLLVGLGVSSVIPIAYGLAGRSKTMSPSAALAAVSTISFLGFLLGPPVIGFIGHLWSLKWSFAVIALLGLGTTFLAGKVRET